MKDHEPSSHLKKEKHAREPAIIGRKAEGIRKESENMSTRLERVLNYLREDL